MYILPTLADQHKYRIETFLANASGKTMELLISNDEVEQIPLDYPNLIVQKKEQYRSSNLWVCVLRKNQ